MGVEGNFAEGPSEEIIIQLGNTKNWADKNDPMGLGLHAAPLLRSHRLWANTHQLEGSYPSIEKRKYT